jgi:hypothetical protein
MTRRESGLESGTDSGQTGAVHIRSRLSSRTRPHHPDAIESRDWGPSSDVRLLSWAPRARSPIKSGETTCRSALTERVARRSLARVRHRRLRRRDGLAVGASGQEFAVELRNQSEDPFARSLGWIRRPCPGAREGSQLDGKRARVAVLRQAVVRRPLGAEEAALDRDADSGSADGVPLDPVAGELEVNRPPARRAPPGNSSPRTPTVRFRARTFFVTRSP